MNGRLIYQKTLSIQVPTSIQTEKILSGENKYVLHFAKNQTPLVNAFWSITMYYQEYFFVANQLNKFTLSPADSLIYNADDASLDLYFQHTPPEEPFILMFRMYWAKVSKLPSINGS
jgi:hypothetical protein